MKILNNVVKKGFTLIELLLVLFFTLVTIPLFIGIVWVAYHFISKFW